jgi:hypothetical protein
VPTRAGDAPVPSSVRPGLRARRRTLILNQAHPRTVLAEYREHDNTARPYQGIGLPVPHSALDTRVTAAGPGTWQIRQEPVLSGLINEYERAA